MRQTRGRGFSLVELIVVLTVMLITATVGALGYARARENQEMRAAAQAGVSALDYARQASIAANSRFQAVFSLRTGEVWVDELDVVGAISRPKVTNPRQLSHPMVFESAIVNGVAVAGDFARVRFWPDGRSDSAGIYFVRSVDDPSLDANITTIKVFGPTGRSQVFVGERR